MSGAPGATLEATTPDDVSKIRITMHNVLLAMSVDPTFLLTCSTPPCIFLEKSTPLGGKFWRGTALPQNLSLRWGRSGTKGQGRLLTLARCSGKNPVEELMTRALLKIHEGYVLELIE